MGLTPSSVAGGLAPSAGWLFRIRLALIRTQVVFVYFFVDFRPNFGGAARLLQRVPHRFRYQAVVWGGVASFKKRLGI